MPLIQGELARLRSLDHGGAVEPAQGDDARWSAALPSPRGDSDSHATRKSTAARAASRLNLCPLLNHVPTDAWLLKAMRAQCYARVRAACSKPTKTG